MNKYLKTFINICFIISIFFLGLILAEYLFCFSIILPSILAPIIFICLCVTFICLLKFCVLISHKNFRELYFNNLIDFYDIVGNGYSNSFHWSIKTDSIKDLFLNGQITLEQLNQISLSTKTALQNDEVKNLFVQDLISFEQLLQIDFNANHALENKNIIELFINNQLSFEQLLQIDLSAKWALENNEIKNLFVQDLISFEQVLQINSNARNALQDDNIRNMFVMRLITFEQLLELHLSAIQALTNNDISLMFLDGHLDFNQILQCDDETRTALNDINTRNQLINNEITWANFYENIHRRAVRDLGTPQIINRTQSTHTASVHESVSDSAIALANQYGKNTNETDVTNHINELKSNIDHFTPNETITPHIYEAAKRGLKRLANLDTDFKDPKSQLSIKQLIALTFLAGKDNRNRQHTYNDYLETMILALYEIQRGYNLNDNSIDNIQEDDNTICTSGTFNKIIEKMVGILPDCHIHFITFDIITFKANQLVKNIISQFFDDRASLELPNEEVLSSLEITQRATYIEHLKDIINSESNHADNPLFNVLHEKLLQDIQSNLEHEFGSQLGRYIDENFTIEQFIDAILNSETIQTFINTKIDRYIERHQTHTNLIDDLSNSSMFLNRSSNSSLLTATNNF